MVATVLKMSVNVCMGLNVSAFTSGSFNLGNLILTVTEQGASDRVIYTNTFASGAANLAGTGTSLHWFTVDVVQPFQVFPNQPIKINLTLDTTLATGTSQAGIMSIAPFLKTAKLTEVLFLLITIVESRIIETVLLLCTNLFPK